MSDSRQLLAVLFTDIESSTRLWEQDAGRMGSALARHDTLVRTAVAEHHGVVVKMIGDGAHAVFAIRSMRCSRRHRSCVHSTIRVQPRVWR